MRKALSLLFVAAFSLAPALAAEKVFTQTTVSPYTIKWSDKDLTATNGSTVVFSARQIAVKEKPKKKDKTTVDRSIRLLSAVGPILSYQDELSLEWPGMVGPGVGDVRRYQAVDLRHPETKANLKSYFAEGDIFLAISNHPLIKKALGKTKPKNLDELMKKIQDSDVESKNESGDTVRLLLNRDMLSQFCFEKSAGNNATVCISLYNQTDNEISPLKLTMPAKNAELTGWLSQADSNKAGILDNKIEAKFKDSETDFHFDP